MIFESTEIFSLFTPYSIYFRMAALWPYEETATVRRTGPIKCRGRRASQAVLLRQANIQGYRPDVSRLAT